MDTVQAINEIISEGLDMSLGDLETFRSEVESLRASTQMWEERCIFKDHRVVELEQANRSLAETLKKQSLEIAQLKKELDDGRRTEDQKSLGPA